MFSGGVSNSSSLEKSVPGAFFFGGGKDVNEPNGLDAALDNQQRPRPSPGLEGLVGENKHTSQGATAQGSAALRVPEAPAHCGGGNMGSL